jgi:putative ABC transport system ATP-binding protein
MTASEHPSPILEIRDLTKRFAYGGGVIEAVKSFNLSANRGEFIAVMGASGSGKSTLLHLVAGLTRPDQGTVKIAGTDINTLGDYALTVFRRQQIGLVFQAFNLIPSLTGEENITLPLLLGGVHHNAHRINALISKLGLEGVCNRRPDAMSGGEQQRIAIGRALASNPSLILADEPTGNLDSGNGRKLCDIFRQLCHESGATVLMVTHNPLVAFAASQFVILKDGQLVSRLDKSDCQTIQELNRAYIEIIGTDYQEGAA